MIFVARTGRADPLPFALEYGISRPTLGDLDGDGDIDAYVSNGNRPNRVYINLSSCSQDWDLDGIPDDCDIDQTQGDDRDGNGRIDRSEFRKACQDLGIDLTAVGTTGFLWKRELDARDSRLRRIAFGARLAALRVTQLGAGGGAFGQTATLADLRRGRGQARRVVLVAAPSDALKQSLAAAAASAAELLAADILVVPLLSLPPGRGAAVSTIFL